MWRLLGGRLGRFGLYVFAFVCLSASVQRDIELIGWRLEMSFSGAES